MSQALIARSPDLQRLRDEGYELEVQSNYLLIQHVPYVNGDKMVGYGTLVSSLTLAGDVTARPEGHVTDFIGEAPCDKEGNVLNKIVIGSERRQLAEDLFVDHMFSSKPPEGYADYHEKMTTYIKIISGPAEALDGEATAKTFAVVEDHDPDSVFAYMETASSRAGIGAAMQKLENHRIAIIGLGGTGSYILDQLAKTPVAEIHLYDGDVFLQHNAFRGPGAPPIEVLREKPNKAVYFRNVYSAMHRRIFAHEILVDQANVADLEDLDFVFIAIDDGEARHLIVERLQAAGKSFIDVGLGLYETDSTLGGQLRVTTSTPEKREHVHEKQRIPFGAGDPEALYKQNIQIADLNALNATLAVIRWKKLCGFYRDLEHEHFSIYSIDGNHLLNEDLAA